MIQAAKTNKVVFMEALKSTLLPNFKAIQDNLLSWGKFVVILRAIANIPQGMMLISREPY